MSELRPLDARDAAAGLREAVDAGRGFLGTDPVTQNDVQLADELSRPGTQVFRIGDTLVGSVLNDRQPRQAYVASTSADGKALRALLSFLTTYQRCTSYVALVPAGSPAAAALADCGFAEQGVLRGHRYGAGAYHDVRVCFARVEDTGCS